MHEQPDLIVTSKTQSAEVLEQLMKDDDFGDIEINALTDQPGPAEEVPPEPRKTTTRAAVEEKPPAADDDTAVAPKSEDRSEPEQPAAAPAAAPPAPEPPAAPPEPKPRPKIDDFLDEEDPRAALTEAMADWKYDERERQKAEKERQDRAAKIEADARAAVERDRQLELDRWNASITVAKSNHDDFDDVVAGAQEHIQRNIDQQKSQALIAEVTGSEMAGEVWYYLAGHPEELARIAKATRYEDGMSALEQRRRWHLAHDEIKKLESQLGNTAAPRTSAPPPRRQPPKPTPVTPVGSHGGSHSVNLNDPKQVAAMDFDEYRQARGMP
jgi:hypothetical protein